MPEETDFWERARKPDEAAEDVRRQMEANYNDFVATFDAWDASVRAAVEAGRPPPPPPMPRLKLPSLPAPLPPPPPPLPRARQRE